MFILCLPKERTKTRSEAKSHEVQGRLREKHAPFSLHFFGKRRTHAPSECSNMLRFLSEKALFERCFSNGNCIIAK